MRRKSNRKVSQTVKEYRKNRRRIQAFIRNAEKRGYKFQENVLPPIPKRITKQSVNRLKKITPKTLYSKALYGGRLTYGEIVPAEKGIKLERADRARKAAETRRIISIDEDFIPPYNVNKNPNFYSEIIIVNFKAQMRQFNERFNIIIDNWLQKLINSYGINAVAEMLEKAAQDGYVINYKVVYSRDRIMGSLARMLDYMPDIGELMKEDIMQSMEEDEDWGDL